MWTPTFFKTAKNNGTVLRVRGRLFYDTEHVVNKDPSHPRDSEPKRITLWEIHPVTELLTCDQGDACDPDNDGHWTRVGVVN